VDVQSAAPAELPENLLTAREAADALGVGIRTVHNALRDGRLRGFRVGPKLFKIPRSALAAFVQPAAEDPDAEFVREVVASAGRLTPEARAEIRRLLPAPSAGGQR
jgi:excisionase family DNA binding protein